VKKFVWILMLAIVVLSLAGCGQGNEAAVVNGEEITMEDLEKRVSSLEDAMANSGISLGDDASDEYTQILKEQALDMMIQEKVLRQELEKRDIELDMESASEYVDQMEQMYGEETFQQVLEMNGLTMESYKEEIAFSEALTSMKEEVTADISVSEQEVQDYFEANRDSFIRGRASHILIKFEGEEVTEEKKEEAREEALQAIQRLEDGEAFESVAKEMSDDGSAAEGGKIEASFSRMYIPYVDSFTLAALDLEE